VHIFNLFHLADGVT